MYGTIIFSTDPIEDLELDSYVLRIIKGANINTIGELQKSMLDGTTLYLIGRRREAYLRQTLRNHGLIATLPWTVRVYRTLFGGHDGYPVISKRGEKELANKLLHWLHDEKPFAHPERVDPAFVFFGRMGIGRIVRSRPGRFKDYDGYELLDDNGRYDDVVQQSGQLARVCNVEVGVVNEVFQNCLAVLREEEHKEEILSIYRNYAETRK